MFSVCYSRCTRERNEYSFTHRPTKCWVLLQVGDVIKNREVDRLSACKHMQQIELNSIKNVGELMIWSNLRLKFIRSVNEENHSQDCCINMPTNTNLYSSAPLRIDSNSPKELVLRSAALLYAYVLLIMNACKTLDRFLKDSKQTDRYLSR